MNVAHILQRTGRIHAAEVALFSGTQPLCTYSDLAERVPRIAGALRSTYGLETGERVAIVSRNLPEFVEILFASWHAGLTVVPVNPKLHDKEIAYILDHCGARACFASRDLLDGVAEHRSSLPGLRHLQELGGGGYEQLLADPIDVAECDPDGVAWIFYTSGTTGRPKGAQLTHRNLRTMTLGYFVDFERIEPGDSILHIGPMCHGSGLYILPHVAAGAANIVPKQGHFDPAEVCSLIGHHRRVGFFAAPTIVRRLTDHCRAVGSDMSNLRLIVYGGAPMYVEDLLKALETFGPKLAQVYGQGETPMAISVLPVWAHRGPVAELDRGLLGSVGYPQSVVEVRIADEVGRPVPPGVAGEVLVRGDTVMKGYLNDAGATEKALRGGWLHTGDIAVADENGLITLKDRSKDVIISGGANIYPREVEEVLLQHPGVAETSVVGVPDPEWGEIVVAFVVTAPGREAPEAELDALCLRSIARFKRPKKYRYLPALPKSHLGKVLKTQLREMSRAAVDPAA